MLRLPADMMGPGRQVLVEQHIHPCPGDRINLQAHPGAVRQGKADGGGRIEWIGSGVQ